MKSQYNFKGVISALPTPFVREGSNKKIDLESLSKLVEFQLKSGINGFVVNGTTAESSTLSWSEVTEIYNRVRKICGELVPIILGTGSNSTAHTIETTKKAEDLGADAALTVVPYYNKPPQRGLVSHFSEVAKNTRLPIILYNVPSRTITSMTLDTIVSLSKIENIFAIKEASGDISFAEKLKTRLAHDFVLLSGDDSSYLPFLRAGGSGIISVMSNAISSACVNWTLLAEQGEWQQAEAGFAKYKDQLLKIQIPDSSAIYLSLASRSSEQTIAMLQTIEAQFIKLPDGNFAVPTNLDTKLFDVLENMIACTIFSYTVIEVFANDSLPKDIKFEKTRGDNKYIELYNKEQIERYLSLDVKLHEILPKVFSTTSPKGTKIWENYIWLKDLRDRFVHLKPSDWENSSPENVDSFVWSHLLAQKDRIIKLPRVAG